MHALRIHRQSCRQQQADKLRLQADDLKAAQEQMCEAGSLQQATEQQLAEARRRAAEAQALASQLKACCCVKVFIAAPLIIFILFFGFAT